MTRLTQSPGTRLILGIAIAAFAQLLSLFLGGAGHGWLTPLPASILLWVLTPAAFILAWSAERSGLRMMLPLIVIAVVSDAWLVKSTIDEENALPFYLQVNGIAGLLIVGLWVASWLFWQVLVLRALLLRREATHD